MHVNIRHIARSNTSTFECFFIFSTPSFLLKRGIPRLRLIESTLYAGIVVLKFRNVPVFKPLEQLFAIHFDFKSTATSKIPRIRQWQWFPAAAGGKSFRAQRRSYLKAPLLPRDKLVSFLKMPDVREL
ncbi:MAG: hypothetical protein HDT33_06270 [Clostridiales bacterium]|nr:hypothetical protein [Clostridiales bacterium]